MSLLSQMRQRAIRVLAARYADHCVRLNQVQVLGSHNSYHIQPPPELIEFYVLSDPRAIQWEYTHAPLDEQFEYEGIRQIELDVYADPLGGLYSQPFALFRVSGNDPNARFEELDAPGLKVHHVVDLDVFTTCSIFVQCLELVKAWSDAHPGHLPIMILVEAKDEAALITLPPLFEGPEFDQLDMEIRSVFPPEQLITPDDVRGDLPTLEEAVLTRGWPTLAESRGHVLFALDNGSKRLIYLEGHPSLRGRMLFTNSVPGESDAAFVKVNDPDPERIADLVRDGYIVRTRADADTLEARANSTERRELALSSGAQYVSTDYAVPDLSFSDYQVTIPDGSPGRCNPVNAPPGCRNAALERLPDGD